MRHALTRFPLIDGALAAYRADGGRVELRREDEDGRPLASIYLAPHEIAGLVHVAELAAVALRPQRDDVPAHVLELLEEADRDDGSMAWYDRELERRARGDA